MMNNSYLTFILGGARSGKSRYAENLALQSGLSPILIATAEAFDTEMKERIARHRADRAPFWHTVEEPLALPTALESCAALGHIVVVDCLTLWLNNLMMQDKDIDLALQSLQELLPKLAAPVIFVSNEVGLGIVPDNALARQFRDYSGRLNQMVAASSAQLFFMVAGLPLSLKSLTLPPQGVL